MNVRAIFLIYLGFIFSYNMIEHDGRNIQSNTLIIKFTKSYAPLLDIEDPLTIKEIEEFQLFNNKENLKDLNLVFNHVETFTDLHYAHDLHQYYKLTLHHHNETFTQIITDLNSTPHIKILLFYKYLLHS